MLFIYLRLQMSHNFLYKEDKKASQNVEKKSVYGLELN